MPRKYHLEVHPAAPRFAPVSKVSALEAEGCLGCLKCVKRVSCVYNVYKRHEFDPAQVVDATDTGCVSCMRCVQECKKAILTRTRNPQYDRLGDEYWRPDIIATLWKQAETGKIPVSGAGYRGNFVGPGFDQMWTDMSEIVRPTRDGIHGREYISTLVELGRRPERLNFDPAGELTVEEPPFIEIPIPVVLDIPRKGRTSTSTRRAMAQAARKAGTLCVATQEEAEGMLNDLRGALVVKMHQAPADAKVLQGLAMVELPWSEQVMGQIKKIKALRTDIVTSVRLLLDEQAAGHALYLARGGAEVIHLQAGFHGKGFGQRKDTFLIKLLREVHLKLVDSACRDQVTLVAGGGVALAEHVAKVIISGADAVSLDAALNVALECRLCGNCEQDVTCPVDLANAPEDWGVLRLINLLGSFHSQIIELLGAMGLREIRRLRGEVGRAMLFDDLERLSFAPIFGQRVVSVQGAPMAPAELDYGPPRVVKLLKGQVKAVASRYRNPLTKFRVERTSACIACGKCAEVCGFKVHVKGGKGMLAPRSQFCMGEDYCSARGAFCVPNCPVDALRVGPNPAWNAFGDPRWTSDLIVSTWEQAATGQPPNGNSEYRLGASGGGFDRIDFVSLTKTDASFKPEDVDMTVELNRRRDEQRPRITIGWPIYGGGMSFGSVSQTTMISRAKAYASMDSLTCTGEGGYPDALTEFDDHVITQVATGLFGVREETIQRVRIVEFKYAQGAKPGLGGHLLGDKVTPEVARMREAMEGNALFSPFPFHSVYSVEDHKKHVDWIKIVNPRALVSVKVSTPMDVDMVAVGSFYAGAHIIHLDGSYGGTGAAPDIAKKNIAMPIEYAIPLVHRFLTQEGIRDQITLVASGGLRSAWDVVKAIALGADVIVIGTADLIALECIRCANCESGRGCPRGIATTDSELATAYDVVWGSQRLINLYNSWAIQLQTICWRLGLKSVRELVGRSDLLTHLDYEKPVDPKAEKHLGY